MEAKRASPSDRKGKVAVLYKEMMCGEGVSGVDIFSYGCAGGSKGDGVP